MPRQAATAAVAWIGAEVQECRKTVAMHYGGGGARLDMELLLLGASKPRNAELV
jgi:hypothetical protein